MISLIEQDNKFIIEFSKNDVSEEFLLKLLRKYKVDKLLNNNEMTENEAWELSEEIKVDWFNNNKKWIIDKIGEKENECNS